MTTITDEQIITLAADHHMPVRFPHEVLAFSRALLASQAATNVAAKLTDEQIEAIYRSTFPRGPYLITPDVHKFARAIEVAVLASLAPVGLETLTKIDMVPGDGGRMTLGESEDGPLLWRADVERWAASHAGAAAEPARHLDVEAMASVIDVAAERELFERMERNNSSNLQRRDDGQYENPCTQSAWEGWLNRAFTPAAAPSSAAIPTVIREAVEAAFEDRADWRTKIAAAVRALGDAPSSADVRAAEVRDAARLEKFIDWYLREGKRSEIHAWGHVERTTREHIMAWLDAAPSTNGEKGEAK